MSLSLVLTFAVTFALLGLALIWTQWPKWLKTVIVLAIFAMYFGGFQTAMSLVGTPSLQALPERFVMLAAMVEEPRGKNPGAIYIWVNPITEGKSVLQPRAYKLPYSKRVHEQVNEGIRKGKDGVSQMGVAENKDGNGLGSSWLQPGNDEQEVTIRDLPVPQLPEK
jgi:hypothetical protein